MLPLIPIALQLAQFAPALLRHFGVGEDKTEVAQAVADLAVQVTGAQSPADALVALKANQELQAKFAEHAMDLDAALEQSYLDDRADARKRDAEFIKAGTHNYRADGMFILACAVIVGLVWVIWKSFELSEFTKGIFTLVLGRFLGYLDNIYNFEFGSTRDSKVKTETIDALAKK